MFTMSHRVRAVLISIAACMLFTVGGVLRAAGPEAWAVPTFESLGLYYNRAMASRGCQVRYRPANTTQWREGYPLVYDPRERQYRGSLVGLKPDTLYDIRLEADGAPIEFQARTRSEEFPIGKTTFCREAPRMRRSPFARAARGKRGACSLPRRGRSM